MASSEEELEGDEELDNEPQIEEEEEEEEDRDVKPDLKVLDEDKTESSKKVVKKVIKKEPVVSPEVFYRYSNINILGFMCLIRRQSSNDRSLPHAEIQRPKWVVGAERKEKVRTGERIAPRSHRTEVYPV